MISYEWDYNEDDWYDWVIDIVDNKVFVKNKKTKVKIQLQYEFSSYFDEKNLSIMMNFKNKYYDDYEITFLWGTVYKDHYSPVKFYSFKKKFKKYLKYIINEAGNN